jgi:hypothetical protein
MRLFVKDTIINKNKYTQVVGSELYCSARNTRNILHYYIEILILQKQELLGTYGYLHENEVTPEKETITSQN